MSGQDTLADVTAKGGGGIIKQFYDNMSGAQKKEFDRLRLTE
jgi:hypothetical protein